MLNRIFESRYLDSYKTQAGLFHLEIFARGAVGQIKVRPAGLHIGVLDDGGVVCPLRLDHRPGTGSVSQTVNLHVPAVEQAQHRAAGVENLDVVERDVLRVRAGHAVFGGERNVAQVNAANRHFGQALQRDRLARSPANHVLNVDVAELRRLFTDRHGFGFGNGAFAALARPLATVIQAEPDGVGGDIGHANVADVNFFHHTAAAARALETQADFGADEEAVVDPDIAHAGGHFAADGHTTVGVIDDAIFNQHVLGGHADAAALLVRAGFQADAVVAHIETRAAHDDFSAIFHVQAVAVL